MVRHIHLPSTDKVKPSTSAVNAEREILDEDLTSFLNDHSAVTQTRAGTGTKFLETSCKQVKKPMQNELGASHLEMMKQVLCLCLKKTLLVLFNNQLRRFWKNGCF